MREALAFLTPFGGARAPSPGALPWFPIVGAVVGAAVGAGWWAAGEVWSPLLAAGVAVVLDLACTGMLHVDGVADSADGLLPHLPRERRLEVMAEPAVGAFGVSALVGVLVLRFSALGSITPEPMLIAGLWAAGRGLMAVTASTTPYARPGGLAGAFTGGRSTPLVIMVTVALAGGLVVLGSGASGALALLVGLVAGMAVIALARRRLGGFTGDVLGAAGVVVETVGLLVIAA